MIILSINYNSSNHKYFFISIYFRFSKNLDRKVQRFNDDLRKTIKKRNGKKEWILLDSKFVVYLMTWSLV